MGLIEQYVFQVVVILYHYIGAIPLNPSDSRLEFDYINAFGSITVNNYISPILHQSHVVPSFGEEIHQTGICMTSVAWYVKLGSDQLIKVEMADVSLIKLIFIFDRLMQGCVLKSQFFFSSKVALNLFCLDRFFLGIRACRIRIRITLAFLSEDAAWIERFL